MLTHRPRQSLSSSAMLGSSAFGKSILSSPSPGVIRFNNNPKPGNGGGWEIVDILKEGALGKGGAVH